MKRNFIPQSIQYRCHKKRGFLFIFSIIKIVKSNIINVVFFAPVLQILLFFDFRKLFDNKILTLLIRERFNGFFWFIDLYIHNYKTKDSLASLKI